MLNLLKALRQDEHGVILSAEIVIVGTVLVIGVMTGMVCLQKSVNSELGDFARAIDSMDQSYSFSGHRKAGRNYGTGGCFAFTAGSAFMNNECNTSICNTDIVGCEGRMILQSGSCGTCGSCGGQYGTGGVCGSCGGQYGTGGVCGSCGGQYGTGGVCGSCGLSGPACYGNANRPDCVSTGVPKMKVTEYPGTSNVPRTSNEGRSPLRFPELEVSPNLHHRGPVPPNAPVAGGIDERLRPIPQTQPLPVTPQSEPQP